MNLLSSKLSHLKLSANLIAWRSDLPSSPPHSQESFVSLLLREKRQLVASTFDNRAIVALAVEALSCGTQVP